MEPKEYRSESTWLVWLAGLVVVLALSCGAIAPAFADEGPNDRVVYPDDITITASDNNSASRSDDATNEAGAGGVADPGESTEDNSIDARPLADVLNEAADSATDGPSVNHARASKNDTSPFNEPNTSTPTEDCGNVIDSRTEGEAYASSKRVVRDATDESDETANSVKQTSAAPITAQSPETTNKAAIARPSSPRKTHQEQKDAKKGASLLAPAEPAAKPIASSSFPSVPTSFVETASKQAGSLEQPPVEALAEEQPRLVSSPWDYRTESRCPYTPEAIEAGITRAESASPSSATAIIAELHDAAYQARTYALSSRATWYSRSYYEKPRCRSP